MKGHRLVSVIRALIAAFSLALTLMLANPAPASASAIARGPHVTWVTVKSGQSMRSIARDHYGSPKYWKIIYDANRRESKITSLIYRGESLRLPPRKHHEPWWPYPRNHAGGIKAVSRVKYHAVYYAYTKIGDWYQWGGTGPTTFDCSGLTMMAYRYAGRSIPRTSEEQAAVLPAAGKLSPGVLLYFAGNSHAAIYIGRGELIDAPHTGAQIGIRSLSGWYYSELDAIRNP